MATFNLVRNSKVFFTTNVDANGNIKDTGVGVGNVFTADNTQELQVLDGFTFSQASNADTITISEAGSTPTRGQRSFNTSLAEAQFSFSTYIRPRGTTTVACEESHLWNALLSTAPIATASVLATTGTYAYNSTTGAFSISGSTNMSYVVGEIYVIKGVTGADAIQFNSAAKVTAVTGTIGAQTAVTLVYLTKPVATAMAAQTGNTVTFSKQAWNEYTSYSEATTALSNKNQLLAFGMIMIVDGITYVIDNCVLDQAVVDFGLDGIAMVAWTGKGTRLRQLVTNVVSTTGTFTGGVTGSYTAKNITANFITNKLSTVSLISNVGGVSGTAYTLALTGGSITIANNTAYVIPANLGIVNLPIGYYTGTRAISGSMTAYLRTGTTNTAGLLSSLLAAAATSAGIEPKFSLQIEIGGAANGTRVEIEADSAFLQIPTIDAAAVMSTTINFTAEAASAAQADNTIDIENTNELKIRYYSAI